MKSFWIRKIFIMVLFSVLFIGELSFQIFTNVERTLVNLAGQEQAELDSILSRADVLSEKQRAEERAKTLEQSKAIYAELNHRAKERKELFQPYSDKIVLADKQIDEAWQPYKEIVAQRQELVRTQFKHRRENAENFLGVLTGIQYGVSASLLAIGLAFFATLIYNRWRWWIFGASFIAQYTACLMIYHGAMLKFSDEWQAGAFAVMFFLCAPLAFHFGTLLFGKEKIGEPATATVTTREHTEKLELSRKQTLIERTEKIPLPDNLDSACRLYAENKISAENGWSQRRIAREFAKGNVSLVNQKIKLILASGVLSPS